MQEKLPFEKRKKKWGGSHTITAGPEQLTYPVWKK